MRNRLWKLVGPLAVVAFAVGCGGTPLETVSGKVTLDGAPLAGASLSLMPKSPPADAKADPLAKGPFVARTDDQGLFSLGPPGDPGGGIPAGAYTLQMTTTNQAVINEMVAPPPERVPQPYLTGVDFEVPDGGNDAANFELKSK